MSRLSIGTSNGPFNISFQMLLLFILFIEICNKIACLWAKYNAYLISYYSDTNWAIVEILLSLRDTSCWHFLLYQLPKFVSSNESCCILIRSLRLGP